MALHLPDILAPASPTLALHSDNSGRYASNLTQARIRVAAVGNIFFDIGDVNFTIAGTNTADAERHRLGDDRRGSPAATAVVATVSDAGTTGSLAVSVSQVPPGLTVTDKAMREATSA